MIKRPGAPTSVLWLSKAKVSASLRRERNCLSGNCQHLMDFKRKALCGLTENFHSLVLEIVLGSDSPEIRDMICVVDLVENDHVSLRQPATSRANKAISLVGKLWIALENIMLHA